MRRIIFLFFGLCLMNAFAQAPQKINYQAIARNASGAVIQNQSVAIEFTIRNGGPTGAIAYQERQSKTTNQFGLFTAEIGTGTLVTGSFAAITWSGPVYLEVGIDPANGTSFVTVSNSQFISVPYALYSQFALNGNPGPQGSPGQSIRWLGPNNGPPSPADTLDAYYDLSNGISFIWNGASWDTLAKSGLQGPLGPQGPQGNPGANGTNGLNGKSLVWKGSQITPPSPADTNFAYYDIGQGVSFVFNGATWDTLSKNGINGTNGTNGTNGLSINWFGNTPPSPANLNDAYYDAGLGVSFIFNGTGWDTLAKNGLNGAPGLPGPSGASINWLGASNAFPAGPAALDAFYHTGANASFIFDGVAWDTLAKDGTPGAINLVGTFSQTIYHDSTGWVATSNLANNGSSVAIGTTSFNSLLNIGNASGSGIEVGFPSASQADIDAAGSLALNSASNLFLKTMGTNRVTIDPAGRVGIGTTTPDASSILDMNSTTAGVLIPRMTATQRLALTGVQGLLVYQTNLIAGFYYFDGVQWVHLAPTGSAWMLNGNAATGTDFIGTTNSTDLVFKVNNLEAMRIVAGGRVAIGNGISPTDDLQVQTGIASPKMTVIGTGIPEVGLGTTLNHTLGGMNYNISTNILSFKANGANKLQLNASGDLGLGLSGVVTSNSLELGTAKSIIFEGTTDDVNETTLGVVNPAADFTYLLPNYPTAGTYTVMTNPTTATGDILFRNSAGVPAALPIGTTGQVLSVAAGIPSWQTLGAASIAPDALDYTEFKDAMTLDAALTLTQGTFGITQSFTGTTTGVSFSANSVTTANAVFNTFNGLTTGTGIYNQSSSASLMGALARFETSGGGGTGTGSALSVTSALGGAGNAAAFITHTGTTASSDIALKVANTSINSTLTNIGAEISASGGMNNYALLVPTGNVGIGITNPAAPLHVSTAAITGLQVDGTNASAVNLTLNGAASAAVAHNYLQGGTLRARHFVTSGGGWMLEVGGNQHVLVTPGNKMAVGGYTLPSTSFGVGNAITGEKFTIAGNDGDATFLDPAGSLIFPPVTAVNMPPMIQMFASGTGNQPRMVIGHSPSFPDWGLEYDDTFDAFYFKSGADTTFGIHLAGQKIRYKDNNQSEGKVLVSDMAGVASWRFSTIPTTLHMTPVSTMTVVGGGGTPALNPVVFTKLESSTYLEVNFSGNITGSVATADILIVRMELNGAGTGNTTGVLAVPVQTGSLAETINFSGLFPSLPAGTYTLDIKVNTNSGSSITNFFINQLDLAGGSEVIVKEMRK